MLKSDVSTSRTARRLPRNGAVTRHASGSEGQVHGDADHSWKWIQRGRSMKKVLIPVGDLPVRRRGPSDAGEVECRGQRVLAKAA